MPFGEDNLPAGAIRGPQPEAWSLEDGVFYQDLVQWVYTSDFIQANIVDISHQISSI